MLHLLHLLCVVLSFFWGGDVWTLFLSFPSKMRIEREKNKKREKKKKEKMTCLRRLSSPRRPRLGKENIVSLFWLKFSSEIPPPKKIERHFPKVLQKKDTRTHTNGAQTLLLLLLLRLTERERLRVLLFFN